MNPRLLLSCAAALAFAVTGRAQNPDQRPDPPPPAPPESPPPSPMMHRHHDGSPEGRDGDRRDSRSGDPRSRLGHLMEAVQHLRAAGLNEPAENLEKMAREMREHIEREQRNNADGKSPGNPGNDMREHRNGERHDGEYRDGGHRDGWHADSGRPPFPHPVWGRPPMLFGRIEEMQKEIRSLSSQVQELRNTVKGRGADQQPSARKPDGPSDGDHRNGYAEGPPRRQDGPPHPEQRSRESEGPSDGDRDRSSLNKHPDQPRNQPPHDDAKREAPPHDGAVRNAPAPPHEGPPRGDAKREGAPPNAENKDGARAESSSGAGRPSELDRARFMALSDQARQKFIQGMRESRDKMPNSSPEERMKFAKELFDRLQAEDKGRRNESSSVDDALRALDVKPPF